jgi:hypothetical protein
MTRLAEEKEKEMNIYYDIIQFLIIAWVGYLLSTKTEFKWWEVLISQVIVGCVLVFIRILLIENELI